jgi:hypothetical protein
VSCSYCRLIPEPFFFLVRLPPDPKKTTAAAELRTTSSFFLICLKNRSHSPLASPTSNCLLFTPDVNRRQFHRQSSVESLDQVHNVEDCAVKNAAISFWAAASNELNIEPVRPNKRLSNFKISKRICNRVWYSNRSEPFGSLLRRPY